MNTMLVRRTLLFCLLVVSTTTEAAQTTATQNPLAGLLDGVFGALNQAFGITNSTSPSQTNSNPLAGLLSGLSNNGNESNFIQGLMSSPQVQGLVGSLLQGGAGGSGANSNSLNQILGLVNSLAPNANISQLVQGLAQNPAIQGMIGNLLNGGNGTNGPSTNQILGLINGLSNNGNISQLVQGLAQNPAVQAMIGNILQGGNGTAAIPGMGNMNIAGLMSGLTGGNGGSLAETMKQLAPMAQIYINTNLNPAFKQYGVRQTCSDDFSFIVQAILNQEDWALHLLDSFGKPSANIMNGEVKWIGSYDECMAVRPVRTDKSGVTTQPFSPKFCRMSGNVQVGPINGQAVMGTCVSDACNNDDLNVIANALLYFAFNGSAPTLASFDCVEDSPVGNDGIAVICILVILGVFVALGTLYDVIVVQLASDTSDTAEGSHKSSNGVAVITHKGSYDMTHENGPPIGVVNGAYTPTKGDTEMGMINGNGTVKSEDVHVQVPHNKPKERSVLEQVLLAFSIYSNGVKILSTHQGAGSLGAINGIRFLSMAWVILGHTYFFTMNYDVNLISHFYQKLSMWTFMAVSYATVSVDSFFAISGVLVAYLTLKELQKVGGATKFNWFMFFFHRFWRLTPPYMLVIMVGTVILPLVYTGPLWSNTDMPFMGTCRDTWWTNLLYINNYVKIDKMCMGWSWYLSNDMQFYILSPLILLPLFYNLVAGGISCMIFLLASTIAAGVVAINHHYTVQLFVPNGDDADYQKNIYFPSYARMGPYVIGLFTGYILYRWKCKCKIPKMINLAVWFVSISVSIVIVYAQYNDIPKQSHLMSANENALYIALHRTGWGMVVCWIVFACATGNGGWINQILSWAPFIPLGRLTYCAYLVHPLVIIMFNQSGRTLIFFTDYQVAYLFLGHLVMSYGVAFITSMFFESPMMGLEKAIFKKGKK